MGVGESITRGVVAKCNGMIYLGLVRPIRAILLTRLC